MIFIEEQVIFPLYTPEHPQFFIFIISFLIINAFKMLIVDEEIDFQNRDGKVNSYAEMKGHLQYQQK